MCGAIFFWLTSQASIGAAPPASAGAGSGTIAGQAFGLEAEALFGPLDHGAGGTDLGLADGARGLDIDNHSVIGIGQIIVGIGKEGRTTQRAGPLRRWIRWRTAS